jgi:hypothetical protein
MAHRAGRSLADRRSGHKPGDLGQYLRCGSIRERDGLDVYSDIAGYLADRSARVSESQYQVAHDIYLPSWADRLYRYGKLDKELSYYEDDPEGHHPLNLYYFRGVADAARDEVEELTEKANDLIKRLREYEKRGIDRN